MSAHVHTCLAHVCMSGLFAIVLSLAFSHPPPPPIITRLYPLFLFCFLSLFLSLPPSSPFFVLPQLIFCTCCLAPLCCSMEPSWEVMQRLSQRKRAATSNLCNLILLLHRVWIDFATVHFQCFHPRFEKEEHVCMPYCLCLLFSECFTELRFHALFQALPECGGYSGSEWLLLQSHSSYIPTSLQFLYILHSSVFILYLHSYAQYTVSICDVCSYCDCMCPSLNENMTGQIYVRSHVYLLAWLLKRSSS